MSIWDNVKKLTMPYSDDDYDELDDYDDDYDDMEEEPAPRSRRGSNRDSQAPKNTRRAPERRTQPKEEPPVQEEEEYEDDYDTSFNSVPKAAPAAPAASSAPAASGGFNGRVVNMNRNTPQEVVRYNPVSFADSKAIAKDLIASKAIILNLEEVDKDTSRRMVDFLSGVVFAMDGDVQKVARSAYVFCPPNVIITNNNTESAEASVEETV